MSNAHTTKFESPVSRAETLSTQEAMELTLALGAASVGDDFQNPEIFGTIAHFAKEGIQLEGLQWQQEAYKHQPDQLDNYVQEQAERYSQILTPYIGKRAVAKTNRLVIQADDGWEELRSQHTAYPPFFAYGQLAAVEGHLTKLVSGRWCYRLGVVMDLSDGYISQTLAPGEPEPPQASRALISPRNFPQTPIWFSNIWSNQIRSARP